MKVSILVKLQPIQREQLGKISLKDRPINETDEERYQIFKPYWDYIQPNGNISVSASVSFLIASLEYLKEKMEENLNLRM